MLAPHDPEAKSSDTPEFWEDRLRSPHGVVVDAGHLLDLTERAANYCPSPNIVRMLGRFGADLATHKDNSLVYPSPEAIKELLHYAFYTSADLQQPDEGASVTPLFSTDRPIPEPRQEVESLETLESGQVVAMYPQGA